MLPNIGSPVEQEVILSSNFYMETRRLPVQPVTIAVHKEISMEANEESTRERLSQMSGLVAECENILFDEAPVMVYSIDESCSLLKVNCRWLAEMGYQA